MQCNCAFPACNAIHEIVMSNLVFRNALHALFMDPNDGKSMDDIVLFHEYQSSGICKSGITQYAVGLPWHIVHSCSVPQ